MTIPVTTKTKSVFHLYLKILKKIEKEEAIFKKYSIGITFNGIKNSASEKRLKILIQKEYDYLDRFTQADKEKWAAYFGVQWEED
jgi:3-methyladenine DNA glycosylase AlkC